MWISGRWMNINWKGEKGSNKRKSFVEPVGMDGSNFKNETLFLSFRERFINYVNGFHPALKFTWEISQTCVSFLDISVSINVMRLRLPLSFVFLLPLTTPSNPSITPNFCAFAAMTKILTPNLCGPNLWKWEPFCLTCGYPTHLLDSTIKKPFSISRRDTLKPPLAKISDDKIP